MSKQIILKHNPTNTVEALPDYIVNRLYSIFENHSNSDWSKKINCTEPSSLFNATSVMNNINEFKKLVSMKYLIEKPINFYAIVRTATSKEVIINELLRYNQFFTDKDLSDKNAIIRIGNIGNVVFYHCPVYTDIRKYHVEVGIKHGRDIVIQNKITDGLCINLEFDREVVKDYRLKDNGKDFSKKFSNKTTEIIKKSLDEIVSTEIHKIPNSISINKLSKNEKDLLGKDLLGKTLDKNIKFTNISKLPINDQNLIVEKNNILFNNILTKPYSPEWKKSHLPLEGNELKEEALTKITTDLKNEYKKIEEQENITKNQIRIDTFTVSPNYQNHPDNIRDYSCSLNLCDYETKKRAINNIDRKKILPIAYINLIKGFYIRDEGEFNNLIRKSDEAVLVHKLEKMLFLSSLFTMNEVYSKFEVENLNTYRITYINHEFIHENNIPFILIKEDEVKFNFYGNQICDKQQITDRTYTSLLELVKDFKIKAKDHLIFIKRVTPLEHVETLSPSWKSINEYKVKCYFLPKTHI